MVAAHCNDNTKNYTNINLETYGYSLYHSDLKYKNVYGVVSSMGYRTYCSVDNASSKGDAMYETSLGGNTFYYGSYSGNITDNTGYKAWYNDMSSSAVQDNLVRFFYRGTSGIFGYNIFNGNNSNFSFRPCIVNL